MNTERIEIEKEEVLKIVNEDWPMLEELGKRRFVINKKKGKDVEESLNALHSVLEEDNKLSEMVEKEDRQIQQMDTDKSESAILQKVKDEKIVITTETPSSQTQKVATITHSEVVATKQQKEVQVNLEKNVKPALIPEVPQQSKKEKVVAENSVDLVKLIVAGFTHLYVSKTSSLLKPIKFVADNYKEVLVAALHFIVPLLITYMITTHVGFVSEQLAKETMLMKSIYMTVFFFGATFVWITSQVLLSGIFSMLRKSMLEVAKVGKENQ